MMGKIAEFYCKVLADEDLRNKLAEILQGRDITAADDEQLQRIGKLAQELGFNLDLQTAKAYLSAEEIAVSDETLDAVAGGKKKIRCEGQDTGAYYDKQNDKWYDRKTGQPI